MEDELKEPLIQEQCVGFARRGLLNHHGSIMTMRPSQPIFGARYCEYIRVVDGARVAVGNVVNGAESPPKVGDLLMYSENTERLVSLQWSATSGIRNVLSKCLSVILK